MIDYEERRKRDEEMCKQLRLLGGERNNRLARLIEEGNKTITEMHMKMRVSHDRRDRRLDQEEDALDRLLQSIPLRQDDVRRLAVLNRSSNILFNNAVRILTARDALNKHALVTEKFVRISIKRAIAHRAQLYNLAFDREASHTTARYRSAQTSLSNEEKLLEERSLQHQMEMIMLEQAMGIR